jgi:hypothetical protein
MAVEGNSTAVDAAEAIKEALNDHDFGIAFTAIRAYAAKVTLEELEGFEGLLVTVMPAGVEQVRATRRTDQLDPLIHIAVQKKLEAQDLDAPGTIDNTEADEMMVLVEAIAFYFRKPRIPGYSQGISISIDNNPIWWNEHMAQLRVFTSVIGLTLRVHKDVPQ